MKNKNQKIRDLEISPEKPTNSKEKLRKTLTEFGKLLPSWQDTWDEILVVEDDKKISKKIEQDLLENNFNTYIAVSGKEALKFCSKKNPILIIVDISLPDQTGYELIEKIRNKKELQSTPIIALTTNECTKTKEYLQLVGCDDSLEKPVDSYLLINTIRSHLGLAPVI